MHALSQPLTAAVPTVPAVPACPVVRRADIETAIARMRDVLVPTPLIHNARRGAFLKLENLQVTGSFKVRGAFNALAAGIERGDRRPVVAASAGNHGQGVAWAARSFGIPACIVVPHTAPRAKVSGARDLGANVIEQAGSFDECAAVACEIAHDNHWRLIHPFDDPDVIAGQGTIAAEMDLRSGDVVLVPIGGGGLAAGISVWFGGTGVRVVGVQVEGVDAMSRLLRGEAARAPGGTIADGLAVTRPGKLSGEICRQMLSEIVLVTEDQVRETVVDLATRDRLIVEGAGAAAVAALPLFGGVRRFVVVSGGNIDFARLAQLSHDIVAPVVTGIL